ncbi:unnamed protein product [Didymodactylos carnosus]|uniref:Synapsin n=1 Tax=Didymodactylos carnosus TaxID=1234261 RepID=A0A813Z0A2_9BILA|nr:unnamed protein product [Didymodactylos carnosus]CAF0959624.1 unnamed protein product [Didymodactylos carnosus]CAF3675741.1 unnamed protein product [Didymodactylos carnosus]CAF3732393.1 unnamed protein product [Didymodactylos carnosus]
MLKNLIRRFSSGDLQNDFKDDDIPVEMNNETLTNSISHIKQSHQQQPWERKVGPSPSAPSSPTRNLSFANQMMHAALGVVNQAMQKQPTISTVSTMNQQSQNQQQTNKEKCKLLLVIDDQHTDWYTYFRGKKIFADWDIRVEQAEFKDINLASYSDAGTLVDINVQRSGTRVVRSFRPDFVLVRQYVRDINIDWTNIILGLQYGGVPGVNSMKALYNFRDKPWVFAELLNIQRRLGIEQFPLINQAYYPNHREMLISPQFPCVLKVGQAHQGLGKVKVENPYNYQDLTSVVAISNCYSTVETFIDARCDVYVQKIGQYYKAFIRKSLTGNWKANTGSAMLEQINMTERYRLWIDEVSQLFGGLDICAVEIVQTKDGKEHIVQVNDSAMQLLGETQDEDRRSIAELVLHKMQIYCRPDKQPTVLTYEHVHIPSPTQTNFPVSSMQTPSPISNPTSHSMTNHSTANSPRELNRQLPNVPLQNKPTSNNNNSNVTTNLSSTATGREGHNPFYNQNSSHQAHLPSTTTTNFSTTSHPLNFPSPNSTNNTPSTHHTNTTSPSTALTATTSVTRTTPSQWMGTIGNQFGLRKQSSATSDGEGASDNTNKDESEDTLYNLKRTFAGIFGDM